MGLATLLFLTFTDYVQLNVRAKDFLVLLLRFICCVGGVVSPWWETLDVQEFCCVRSHQARR